MGGQVCFNNGYYSGAGGVVMVAGREGEYRKNDSGR